MEGSSVRGGTLRTYLLPIGDWIRGLRPTALLTIPLALFLLGAHWNREAYRAFDGHRQALAEAGGGVLFVMQPQDCGGTAGTLEQAGVALIARDIPIRGLIMPGPVSHRETQTVLGMANDIFPHFLVSNRTVATLAAWAGISSTPVALIVDSSGSLAGLVSIGDLQPARLVERLVGRLSEGA